jgi:Ser/Thr protein kinase RdoA (MazF antagonist)
MQPNTLAVQWPIGDVHRTEQLSARVCRVETSTGHIYYLKRHGGAELLPEHPLLHWLNSQGIRTELPLLTHEGRVLVSEGQVNYALYPALPGSTVDVAGSAHPARQAHGLGRAIGQLHLGLAQYSVPEPSPFPRSDLWGDANGHASILMAQRDLPGLDRLPAILEEINTAVPKLQPDLIQHLIHRDSHPTNILFDECGRAGFVDFELLRQSVRVFDPCYCSTALLADAYADPASRSAWQPLAGEVIAGYDSVCPLSAAEWQAIEYVAWAIQVIFAGWWARKGNSEQAGKNMRLLLWLCENGDWSHPH